MSDKNEPEARLDFNETERVDQTINRVMDTQPPNIGWMSSELANKLLHALSGARTLMMMSLLRAGMDQETAKKQADMQAPLLLFDLGLRVGKDMGDPLADQLRELWGGDGPPDFPPDEPTPA